MTDFSRSLCWDSGLIMHSTTTKEAATTAIRRRHTHLSAMAAGGTDVEREIAAEKLRRLEAKYDFTAAAGETDGSLFANWLKPQYSQKGYPVLKVQDNQMDVGNLVKWVFTNKFGTAASWRHLPEGAELILQAQASDVKNLKSPAKDLLKTIVAACDEFFQGQPTTGLKRAPFLSGLYDGLLNAPRPAGSMIPGYSPLAKKRVPRRRTAKSSEVPAGTACIHPYDFGWDVGRKISFKVPCAQLCESIRLAVGESP